MADGKWQMAGNGLQIMVVEEEQALLPAPTILDVAQEWVRQFELWLESPKRRAPGTQRAYRSAWQALLGYTGKMPWQITKSDVAEWGIAMREHGLGDCTIQQRIAAVSSFYRYAMEEAEIVLPNGSRSPLHGYNPAGGKSLRPSVMPYDKAEGLTNEQAVALIRVILPNSVQGLRDRALFRLYLATGRRNQEIRCLRVRDVEVRGELVRYKWKQKRNEGWDEIPQDIWEDILKYLEKSGRAWDTLTGDDPIFTALVDAAKHLPNMAGRSYQASQQPISGRQVLGLLKHYARKAGLDWKLIHVHTLRHTTADMMREAGFDVMDIKERLGHKNLNTTQIYLTRKRTPRNAFWKRFKALNEID